MLYNVALKFVLVVMIVMQSLTAVASVTTENHQVDIDHIQIKHDHNSDHTDSGKVVDSEGHEVNDCHHCGHCSGSHLSWILVKEISNFYESLSNINTPYYVSPSKAFLEAILRPPIS